jgi:hypothetical protein
MRPRLPEIRAATSYIYNQGRRLKCLPVVYGSEQGQITTKDSRAFPKQGLKSFGTKQAFLISG